MHDRLLRVVESEDVGDERCSCQGGNLVASHCERQLAVLAHLKTKKADGGILVDSAFEIKILRVELGLAFDNTPSYRLP
jgi:hypothetical protein